MKRREFAVIVKGILASRLYNIYNLVELLIKLKKHIPSIVWYKIQLPKTPYKLFANIVLYISSIVAAQEAY